MTIKRIFWIITALVLPIFSSAQFSYFPEGNWKGSLTRTDGIVIPFTFETTQSNGNPEVYIINADDKLLVNDIQQIGDSLQINLPFFDAKFVISPVSASFIKGNYYKTSGDKIIQFPFEATFNEPRFLKNKKATFNISGKWEIDLNKGRKPDVGIFTQDENGKVTGTILTPSGDYRFMEGILNGDSLQLSVFDGGYTMLLTAKVTDNQTIENGIIFSGLNGKEKWSAKRNDNLQLQEEELTKMRAGEDELTFSFTSTDGKTVSLSDEKYKGKVVLVQILGSWCPNCMDETAFLSDYFNKNKQRGLEVIGIAYERTTDFEKNKKLLQPYIDRFDVQYPILLPPVKVSDPEKEQKTLPQLDKIRAYPSLIYIGKNGKVQKIHSGFNGPATGVFYEQYKKDFYQYMDKLLSE